MLKSIVAKLLLFVVVVGGGALFFLFPSQPLPADGIPDTPEAQEIKATLTRDYELLDTPADWLDVARLSEVFIDHPDYAVAVGADIVATLKAQISNFLGPADAQNFGYLTAIKSKKIHRQRGIELLKAAQKKGAGGKS